jgi:hypothetical protein
MQEINEKGGITGTVIVRSHPAGTIEQIKTLHELGRHDDANTLLKIGKVAVEQKNIIVFSLNYGYDILVQFLLSAYNGVFSINNATTLSGTTDGSTGVITGLSSTSGLALGMLVSGAGIPAFSTLITINSSTSVTISQNTTAAATVPIAFAQIQQLGIAWGEIGTGSTAPANTDTALTTPTNRTSVSYGADSAFNEAQIQFFFPDAALANQTYYEFGTFIGGSSTIGSGNMFNHALFGTSYVKTAGTDTTVEVDFEFGS